MSQENNKPQSNLDIKIELQKFVLEEIKKSIAFTQRKLGDTPTDNLMVVNRKYVNLNGLVANRPNSSVAQIGQRYFPTDIGIPMTYKGSNQWVNGVGSVIA